MSGSNAATEAKPDLETAGPALDGGAGVKRNPLLTHKYYSALHKFHKQHPGAIPPVLGTPPKEKKRNIIKAFKPRESVAGRKDASAPVRSVGGPPGARSDEPGNWPGVGAGNSPGNTLSDEEWAAMLRAYEAPPMRVDQDR